MPPYPDADTALFNVCYQSSQDTIPNRSLNLYDEHDEIATKKAFRDSADARHRA